MNKWIATIAFSTFAVAAFAQSPNEPFQTKTPDESATLPNPGTTGTSTTRTTAQARADAAARADARKAKRSKRVEKRAEKVGNKPLN